MKDSTPWWGSPQYGPSLSILVWLSSVWTFPVMSKSLDTLSWGTWLVRVLYWYLKLSFYFQKMLIAWKGNVRVLIDAFLKKYLFNELKKNPVRCWGSNLVEYFLNVHKPQFPAFIYQEGVPVQACNSSTGEVGAGKLEAQGHLRLHRETKASLSLVSKSTDR